MRQVGIFSIAIYFVLLGACSYSVPAKRLVLIDDADIKTEPIKKQVGDAVISPEEICTTYEMEWAAGNKESLLLDPSTDVIFPGAVIQSESIQTGQFIPVMGDRLPIIISSSLPGLGISSDTVETPVNSTVVQSINKILNSKVKGSIQPAQYAVTVTQINSQEDFNMKLNAKYAFPTGSVRTGFDFSSGNKKSRFFVDFTQIFYTINVNSLSPDAFFKKAPKTPLGFSPVYVSSIKYGRRIILTIESESNYNDKKVQIEAELKAMASNAQVDANATVTKLMSEKSIKALGVGGSPDFSLLEDPALLIRVLKNGAIWDHRTNPGLPLAYTLRHAIDNSVFKVAQSGRYVVRECVVNPTDVYVFKPEPSIIRGLIARSLGGDNEFKGHGPKVDFTYSLINIDNEIFLQIHCTWLEWDAGGNTPQNDFTSCAVDDRISLGMVPDKFKVLGINGNASLVDGYVDSNEQLDGKSYRSDESFIKSWSIVGDTQGDDIGRTGIAEITLYPILVNVKKIKL